MDAVPLSPSPSASPGPTALRPDAFARERVLGQGAFGIAVLVRDVVTGRPFVLKRINLGPLGPRERAAAAAEEEVLTTLAHPNIIGCYGSFLDADGAVLNIVLEYADAEDLATVIAKASATGAADTSGSGLPEPLVLSWLAQLASALRYVHGRRILHRDIKCQNVLLSRAAPGALNSVIVKLGDFGIARVLEGDSSYACTSIGSPYTMSPEVVNGRPYSYASDVWSLGCVLYQLVTGAHAFGGTSMGAVVLSILRGAYPPIPPGAASEPLRALVHSMLAFDPSDRPSMDAVVGSGLVQAALADAAAAQDAAGAGLVAAAQRELLLQQEQGGGERGADLDDGMRSEVPTRTAASTSRSVVPTPDAVAYRPGPRARRPSALLHLAPRPPPPAPGSPLPPPMRDSDGSGSLFPPDAESFHGGSRASGGSGGTPRLRPLALALDAAGEGASRASSCSDDGVPVGVRDTLTSYIHFLAGGRPGLLASSTAASGAVAAALAAAGIAGSSRSRSCSDASAGVSGQLQRSRSEGDLPASLAVALERAVDDDDDDDDDDYAAGGTLAGSLTLGGTRGTLGPYGGLAARFGDHLRASNGHYVVTSLGDSLAADGAGGCDDGAGGSSTLRLRRAAAVASRARHGLARLEARGLQVSMQQQQQQQSLQPQQPQQEGSPAPTGSGAFVSLLLRTTQQQQQQRRPRSASASPQLWSSTISSSVLPQRQAKLQRHAAPSSEGEPPAPAPALGPAAGVTVGAAAALLYPGRHPAAAAAPSPARRQQDKPRRPAAPLVTAALSLTSSFEPWLLARGGASRLSDADGGASPSSPAASASPAVAAATAASGGSAETFLTGVRRLHSMVRDALQLHRSGSDRSGGAPPSASSTSTAAGGDADGEHATSGATAAEASAAPGDALDESFDSPPGMLRHQQPAHQSASDDSCTTVHAAVPRGRRFSLAQADDEVRLVDAASAAVIPQAPAPLLLVSPNAHAAAAPVPPQASRSSVMYASDVPLLPPLRRARGKSDCGGRGGSSFEERLVFAPMADGDAAAVVAPASPAPAATTVAGSGYHAPKRRRSLNRASLACAQRDLAAAITHLDVASTLRGDILLPEPPVTPDTAAAAAALAAASSGSGAVVIHGVAVPAFVPAQALRLSPLVDE